MALREVNQLADMAVCVFWLWEGGDFKCRYWSQSLNPKFRLYATRVVRLPHSAFNPDKTLKVRITLPVDPAHPEAKWNLERMIWDGRTFDTPSGDLGAQECAISGERVSWIANGEFQEAKPAEVTIQRDGQNKITQITRK